jgi:hypothetical protein
MFSPSKWGVKVLTPHILSLRFNSTEKFLIEILSPHLFGGMHSHGEGDETEKKKKSKEKKEKEGGTHKKQKKKEGRGHREPRPRNGGGEIPEKYINQQEGRGKGGCFTSN